MNQSPLSTTQQITSDFHSPSITERTIFSGLFDTSRICIFGCALFLIIYGSKRSLSVDSLFTDSKDEKNKEGKGSHTIELSHAIFLPIGASLSLLTMFLFFNVFQFFFIISTTVLSVLSFSFLLLQVCEKCFNLCNIDGNSKISLRCCNDYTRNECLSLLVSTIIVSVWIFTGHWILMDAIGCALCVTMLSYIRLPNLKVATLLLVGLLVYDVFWVFLSEYIFNDNVMLRVATRPAYNPMNYVAKKLNIHEKVPVPKNLSLPGKLMFPSSRYPNRFGMLGLGDIVLPGLLISFILRFEKSNTKLKSSQGAMTGYYNISVITYFIGLLIATTMSEMFQAAQPALLYLVPCILIPLIIQAYRKGDLSAMWNYDAGENSKEEQLIV